MNIAGNGTIPEVPAFTSERLEMGGRANSNVVGKTTKRLLKKNH
jgi:hypothetical protein